MHPAKEENMRLATEENMRPATEENMRPATEETPLLPRYTPTTRRQSNGRQSSRTLPRFRNVLALVSVVWTGLLLFYWRIYASQPPVPPSQPSVPPSQPPAPPDPYQIAVIGAGPTGVFAAAYLRKLSRSLDRPLKITVFDRKASVGGRLVPDSLVYPLDDPTQPPLIPESASHRSLTTDILCKAVKEWGVRPQTRDHSEVIGYYACGTLEFIRPFSFAPGKSRWWEFWSFGRVPQRIRDMGTRAYRQLYQTFSPGTLNSPYELVQSLDLSQSLSKTSVQFISERGIYGAYVDKVLQGEMQIQYGQHLDSLNGLAVSIAAYNADDGRKPEAGSLALTLKTILSQSNVDLRLSTEVFGARKLNKTNWILAFRQVDSPEEEATHMFDGVVLASPLTAEDFEFHHSNLALSDMIKYKSRQVTWFSAPVTLDPSSLGLSSSKSLPQRIITHPPPSWHSKVESSGYIEILNMGEVIPTNDRELPHHMYRILSDSHIVDEDLQALIGGSNTSWIYRHQVMSPALEEQFDHTPLKRAKNTDRHFSPKIPYAYPIANPRTAFPPILLDDSFWHPLAIEAVSSSVDISIWSGKNVAGLVISDLMKRK